MIWRLAYRNIWRNKRRTLLTLSAMALSAGLLIFIMAVSEAWMDDILLTTTGQYTGQAQVTTAEYRRDEDFFSLLREPQRLREKLMRDPEVRGASPRLRAFGLFSAGSETVAGEILGIRWDQEREVTSLHEKLVAGRYPEDDGGPGAVLGEGLAGKLKLGLGDELVFVTQAADGSIGNELFTVAGIYRTGDFGRDNYLVLAGSGFLGGVLAMEGQAHEIALALGNPALAREAAARLEPLVRGAQEDARVLSWQEMLPLLAEIVNLFEGSMVVTTAIFYVAAGMVVVNTLLMAFYERTREFGVLQALGMTPWRIRRLILAEALLLGIIASILGTALGAAASLAIYRGIDLSSVMGPISFSGGSFLPVLRAVIRPRDIYIPFVGMVILSVAAVMYPIFRGGRRPPAEELQKPIT